MALLLAAELKELKTLKITQKVESNGIFIIMPARVAERVQKHYFFYPWDEKTSEYRLMTSWDTTEEDIEGFISVLRRELEE